MLTPHSEWSPLRVSVPSPPANVEAVQHSRALTSKVHRRFSALYMEISLKPWDKQCPIIYDTHSCKHTQEEDLWTISSSAFPPVLLQKLHFLSGFFTMCVYFHFGVEHYFVMLHYETSVAISPPRTSGHLKAANPSELPPWYHVASAGRWTSRP